MKMQRIDHVGIVVRDFAAAKAFFTDLGLEVTAEWEAEGELVDRVVGLDGVKASAAMLRTPDGGANIELTTFHSPSDDREIQPPAANALGIRHITFVVDDIDAVVARLQQNGVEIFSAVQRFEDSYKLCYVRGPEGMIVELAEELS
jgi:catechol 2,3-dioxygenase-like lactoylglutathione lyase family enzyme